MRRLECHGQREAYEKLLIREYGSLKAIEEEPRPEEPRYYLPPHTVVREEVSTTKVRVVFDASAHPRQSKSLNDLYPGPSLLPDIAGLLVRFSEKCICLASRYKKGLL